jgi:hypothetical protein
MEACVLSRADPYKEESAPAPSREFQMAERYVRPTVSGWLTPTLIAPWLSVYGAITAIAVLGVDRGLFGKVLGWTVGMVVGSLWAFVFCALLLVVDLALLGVKVRTLPAGQRGWALGFLSPLMVLATYVVLPPYKFFAGGPWAVAAGVLGPMLLVAVGSRVLAGTKLPR